MPSFFSEYDLRKVADHQVVDEEKTFLQLMVLFKMKSKLRDICGLCAAFLSIRLSRHLSPLKLTLTRLAVCERLLAGIQTIGKWSKFFVAPCHLDFISGRIRIYTKLPRKKHTLNQSAWKSPKMSHLNFWILAFSNNFCLIKLTCLVTLFDHKLQVFKNLPKLTIFGILINFCPLKM